MAPKELDKKSDKPAKAAKTRHSDRRAGGDRVKPEGEPSQGFQEDWQFREYERTGTGFRSLSEVLDIDEVDASGSISPHASGLDADEGRSTMGSREGEIGTDVDLPEDFPAAVPDLRFGGEDVSGVSEWTMRARRLELDDGLDGADFARSDEAILGDVLDALRENVSQAERIECSVTGGVVTLKGAIESPVLRERLELLVKDLPGVREVNSSLLA